MFSPVVVEVHPAADAFSGLGYGVVGGEVDFFVFEAAPEPFDEYLVDPAGEIPAILPTPLFPPAPAPGPEVIAVTQPVNSPVAFTPTPPVAPATDIARRSHSVID